jgi:hypothetical protein
VWCRGREADKHKSINLCYIRMLNGLPLSVLKYKNLGSYHLITMTILDKLNIGNFSWIHPRTKFLRETITVNRVPVKFCLPKAEAAGARNLLDSDVVILTNS